jgi:hypothetical protein
MQSRLLAVAVFVGALVPSMASAQVCVGRPDLTIAPINAGASVDFTDGGKAYGVNLGFGSEVAFGQIGLGLQKFDDFDESATALGLGGGLIIRPSVSSKMKLCPMVQGTFGFGPNSDSVLGDVKTSFQSILAGVALGGPVDVNPGFKLIPNAFAGVLYQRVKVTLDDEGESVDDTGGAIGGGVSLLFNDTFAIIPSVSIPVGFDSNDPVYTIGFSIGFKRRK